MTLAAGLILALMPIQAVAVQLTCSVVGDGMGWSIATGHDFDGDGIEDLAASGPCAYLRGVRLAGRVLVYSGADGSKSSSKTSASSVCPRPPTGSTTTNPSAWPGC